MVDAFTLAGKQEVVLIVIHIKKEQMCVMIHLLQDIIGKHIKLDNQLSMFYNYNLISQLKHSKIII